MDAGGATNAAFIGSTPIEGANHTPWPVDGASPPKACRERSNRSQGAIHCLPSSGSGTRPW